MALKQVFRSFGLGPIIEADEVESVAVKSVALEAKESNITHHVDIAPCVSGTRTLLRW